MDAAKKKQKVCVYVDEAGQDDGSNVFINVPKTA
jgi:hypothetical protein